MCDEECLIAAMDVCSVGCFDEKEWFDAVECDRLLKKVKDHIVHGWPKEKHLDVELQPFAKIAPELSLEGGEMIMRGDKLIPPECLRARIVNAGHEGHLGQTSTKRRICAVYWWPSMDHQIDDAVRGCVICCSSDKVVKAVTPPTQVVELPSGPWMKLAVDFVGPFNALPNRYKFALVVADYYRKWWEVHFMVDPNTQKVIKCFQSFCQGRFPQRNSV